MKMLKIMLLVFTLLVFKFHLPSVSANVDFLTTKYPGLTLFEARCPERLLDDDYWYIVPVFNSTTPVCVGRTSLPSNLQSFTQINDACKKKHAEAFPARLLNDQKLENLQSTGVTKNAVIGGYYYVANSVMHANISNDHFVVYLQNDKINAANLQDLNPNTHHILCMTPAFPRFMHSYYAPPMKVFPNLDEYTCEGMGWDLQSFCDGPPQCYKRISKLKAPLSEDLHIEFNACGMEEPNSYAASMHCDAERNYLTNKYTDRYLQVGLFLPYRGPWRRFTWEWADGTPANYVPWYNNLPDGYCHPAEEKNANVIAPGGSLNDINIKQSWPGMPAICKKLAVKKQLPLEIKKHDIFKVKGKRCKFERPTHWNQQCPTNSSLWQIVQSEGGVHCYALVDAPLPFSQIRLTHQLCHNLHPQAKLASFHYDRQFGFLYPMTDLADKVIVGLIPKNNSFSWADGSSMSIDYWAPAEPSLITNDTFVRIQRKHRCPTQIQPMFKTEKIDDATTDMKIACKIKASPLLPCAPVPDADGMESLDNTDCKDGWIKQRFCDKVYCYKRLDVAKDFQNFKKSVETDYCHSYEPHSHLASVHCMEEHYFVQNFSAKTLIGLHIPSKFHNDPFDVKNFKWTDGTVVDFVGWNRFSLPEFAGQYAPLFPTNMDESLKFSQVYNKNDDTKSGWSNQFAGFQNALCKMKATIKEAHNFTNST